MIGPYFYEQIQNKITDDLSNFDKIGISILETNLLD